MTLTNDAFLVILTLGWNVSKHAQFSWNHFKGICFQIHIIWHMNKSNLMFVCSYIAHNAVKCAKILQYAGISVTQMQLTWCELMKWWETPLSVEISDRYGARNSFADISYRFRLPILNAKLHCLVTEQIRCLGDCCRIMWQVLYVSCNSKQVWLNFSMEPAECEAPDCW